MSYFEFTNLITKPLSEAINEHLEPNSFKNKCLNRAGRLLLIPVSTIACGLEAIVGLGSGFLSIVSLGTSKNLFKFSRKRLSSTYHIFVHPYVNFLKTINPKAKFSGKSPNIYLIRVEKKEEPKIIGEDQKHFLLGRVVFEVAKLANALSNSKNPFLEKHIASRCVYVILGVSCVIARVADAVIAVPAVSLSILALGTWESANNLAYRTLQAPGIITDLFFCSVCVLNPGIEKT